MGKFVLDVMDDARGLPKDQKPIYFEAIKAGLKAISQGRGEEVLRILEER
jgi:hypothetical protein